MTLAANPTKLAYPGPGGTSFVFPYPVVSATHLVLHKTVQATGVVAGGALLLGTDYTVSGAGGMSVTVTLTADLGAFGLLIQHIVPITQDVSLANEGAFRPKAHEAEFDKLTQISLQLQEQIDRALVAPANESPGVFTPVEGSVLGWVSGKWAMLSGASVALAANLLISAAGYGTSLIDYLAPYTGAVGRLLRLKLTEYVSVTDFGASPSASATVNTAAFIAALAASWRVYVPAGIYNINGLVYVPAYHLLFGDGPLKSVMACDTSAAVTTFLLVDGRNTVTDIGVQGVGSALKTGVSLSGLNPLSGMGHIKLDNLYIKGFAVGLHIDNGFDVLCERVECTLNTLGCRVLPTYDAGVDSGYVTTVHFLKCYFGFNTGSGFTMTSFLKSKVVTFTDTIIESNGAVQSTFENVQNLRFNNVYWEKTPAVVAATFKDCEVSGCGMYVGGTGGFTFSGGGTYSFSQLLLVAATDIFVSTTGALGTFLFENCAGHASATFTLTDCFQRIVNSTFAGRTYQNWSSNLGLTLTNNDPSNVSKVDGIQIYKKTVSGTVPANDRITLITDQLAPFTWSADTVAIASFNAIFQPDLVLTVTPSTAGNTAYFCVIVRNLTAAPIVLTNATLKIMFFRCTGMAI